MKFDSYHPAINLIYFVSTIAFTIWFNHPVFLALGYLCAFAYSVKLNGVKQLIFNILIIVPGVAFALWYGFYHHFGVTELRQNFIGNKITLEALVYGGTLSVTVLTVIMLFSCMFAVFTSDKVVYLFGRVSPKLSLFLAVLLRAVPRVKAEAKKINTAQKGIGRGTCQGNALRRFLNLIRELSMLITWMLESFLESSHSMQSRGYSLKGRTAFSIYRFDNRDRSFVIAVFACLVWIVAGVLLDQTRISYDPRIIFNKITPLSYLFYAAYVVLLLLPMGLQIAGEARFKRLRNLGNVQ